MRLTKIAVKNFKGTTGSLELSAVNVLLGSNWAGKTTWTDAVRLALIGFLPELGKLPRATFSLASGREMSVEGTFEDGSTVSRRFYLKGDTVKVEEVLPPWIEGQTEPLLVSLNAEEYFSKSDRERVAYVSSNVPGANGDLMAGFLAGEFPAKVSEILREKDPEIDMEKAKASFAPLREKMVEAIRQAVTNINGIPPLSLQADLALVATKEAESAARHHEDAASKTCQMLSALRTTDAPEQPVERLEAEKKALDKETDALRERRAGLRAKIEERRLRRERREKDQRELSAEEGLKLTKDALENKIDALEHDLSSVAHVSAEDADRLRDEERALSLKIADGAALLRAAVQNFNVAQKDLLELESKTSCPYCGAEGTGWKDFQRKKLLSAGTIHQTERSDLENALGQAQTEAGNLRTRISGCSAALKAQERIKGEIADRRNELKGVELRLEGLSSLRSLSEPATEEEAGLDAALADVDGKLQEKFGAITRLEDRIKAVLGRQNDVKRLAQAEGERETARIDLKVAKAVSAAIEEEKRKAVEEIFRPLMETANALFGGILKTPLSYNPEKTEIGTWRDGLWVGHKTFSGTEKMLTYAAIQMALASRSKVRVMLLDEMGKIASSLLPTVLCGMMEGLTSGKLDQVFCLETERKEIYDNARRAKALLPVFNIVEVK